MKQDLARTLASNPSERAAPVPGAGTGSSPLDLIYTEGEPYPIVVSPGPHDLSAILTAWQRLDAQYVNGRIPAERWVPLRDWLVQHGVTIIEPRDVFRLEETPA
ncbi:MAG: hypothetical protein AB1411_02480 [Nitrospirota bacterium]